MICFPDVTTCDELYDDIQEVDHLQKAFVKNDLVKKNIFGDFHTNNKSVEQMNNRDYDYLFICIVYVFLFHTDYL